MGSHCWKLTASVREQFFTYWPEGIVRIEEGDGDVALFEMPRRVCLRLVNSFPFLFHCHYFFFLVNFQGKLGRLIREKQHFMVTSQQSSQCLPYAAVLPSSVNQGLVVMFSFLLGTKPVRKYFHMKDQCFCVQFYGILTKLV